MHTRTLLALLLLAAPWSTRALDLTGQVVDPAKAPVAGATVMILAERPRTGSSPLCP
ncbi:MAG: hypothetical protein ABJF10_11455 [Chthoniobacter sp.]|uniref:hypothetical protein n=1 Tax=Chthoniobacter sp. TaxID=2510640 RepID=UPI0032A554E2